MDVLSMCLMPISVIQPPSDLSLFASPLCSHLTEIIFENDSEVGWGYGSLKGVCWLTCAFCVQFDFVVFSRLFLLVDVSRICFSSISVYFVALIWFSWSLNSLVLNAKDVTVGSLWFLRKHPFGLMINPVRVPQQTLRWAAMGAGSLPLLPFALFADEFQARIRFCKGLLAVIPSWIRVSDVWFVANRTSWLGRRQGFDRKQLVNQIPCQMATTNWMRFPSVLVS